VPLQAPKLPPERVLSVSELITASSIKYSVKRQIIADVIQCESSGKTDAIGKLGEVGIVQILPRAWPSISREQMLDASFSIDFLAYQLSIGHGYYWMCYNDLYGKKKESHS
jgi:soluble lytic murein transglycosylase-like protein